MRIKVTLRRPGSPGGTNLQITADATATAADIATTLAAADPTQQQFVGARNLTLRRVDPSGQASVAMPGEVSIFESGLRSGSVIELGYAEAHTGGDGGAPAALLRVISGPDTGVEAHLPIGVSDIGRSGSCFVKLRDPMVSKLHARINVGQRIEIVDTNSANGVVVGGVKVSRVTLGSGDVVTVGGTQFTIIGLRPVSDFAAGSTDIRLTRSPRVLTRPKARKISLPDAPAEPGKTRFPYLAMAAPLVMGAVLFAVSRSALSLVFIGLSPLLMVGNYVEQRVQSRARHRGELAAFEARLAEAEVELRGAHATERAQLEQMYPSVADCLDSAARLNDILWSRRPELPEFLVVRLGKGVVAPMSRAEAGRPGLPEYTERARAMQTRFADLADAPVVADLRSVGGVGLCGERGVLDGVARGVVLQLAVLHSPAEVILSCLTSTEGKSRWEWLEWLPHTSSPHSSLGAAPHLSADPGTGKVLLDLIEELLELRMKQAANTTARGPLEREESLPLSPLPAFVVIVDEPSVDIARLNRVAEQGPDLGVHVVWVSSSKHALPGACRTFLDVGDGSKVSVGMVRQGIVLASVACESVDPYVANEVARSLAPVVDSGAPVEDESDLPRSVAVVTLLGQEAADDASIVLTRWRENQSLVERDGRPAMPRERAGDLRAVVGHTGAEAFALDLRTQGPHALVGGTTGAGKSEFLQAWVLGLAHAYSPDRVTFLFVDYKGGAAFAPFEELPHKVGIVTDLSPYLVNRALKSLRAEIRYREHLLNAKGAKDLIELELTGDPECPPSLVIVIDEFAALVKDVPDFVDGVVDVAQRGRSLGLHLITATQRPAGVINDNLRANTNLRVALRMNDEQDSADVLGATMAAHFDPSLPGRAAARTGPGRIMQFQSAFPGARTPPVPPAPPIEVVELDFGVGRQWKMPERKAAGDAVPKDISRVVTTIGQASGLGGIPTPRKPWLDALAQTYDLLGLDQRRDTRIVLGVVDDPDNQEQVPEFFEPDREGNILFVGTGGSGKSTALRTLACAAAITPREGLTHVYGLDFAGGGLTSLEALPNVGSIVPGDDEDSVGRLLRYLVGIIEERALRYSALRAESLVKYRELADRSQEARILLLLDGFGNFRTTYEGSVSLLAQYNLFQRILIDGRTVGVHVAMTADRPSVVPTSVAASFQRTMVLRQSAEDAYAAMGVPKDILTPTSPPGRAMQVGRPLEMQLAILGTDLSTAGQARMVERLVGQIAEHHPTRPRQIQKLSAVVPAAEVPAQVAGRPVLGKEDATLAWMGFDPTGIILLSGPGQSGRTMAIRWLAESMRRALPDVPRIHFSASRTPLSGLDLWTISRSDVDSVAERLGTVMQYAMQPQQDGALISIFVEGLPDFVGSVVEEEMTALVRLCRRNGHLLVAEGESAAWGSPWPLVMEIRNARTGLLLQPEQADGDNLLRTPLPRARRSDFPPGRGFWVKADKAAKVQLPLIE